MIGLTLDPPTARGLRAGPDAPTMILPLPGRPIRFADLPALARKVHQLRGDAALQLSPGVAAYDGSDTFPIFKLWLIGVDETPRYAATLAVQGASRERLEAAIAAANPAVPQPLTGRAA